MEKTKTFEELNVWKSAHNFTLLVYKFTEQFPKTENFGLTSQFRRANISITANIAEGYKKKGTVDKLRFYNISQRSLEECRYYILLAFDLSYISKNEETILKEKIEETSKLLNSYYRAIAQNS